MKDFDIQMQVKLCSKHKEFFEKKVKVNPGQYIAPSALVELLKEARNCIKCVWETKFGE